ncbi:MAG: hypothetical protein O9322_02815 [Beijerinckiaceae bacterium]|nr:hypothetical protein [Beijerinckiaceae bacterium]MCZ8301496.1 hypothetical protein [Beijerinckiaceae bacterium]
MNMIVKTLATALLGLGLSVGMAQAALSPKAAPEPKPAAKNVRPVIKESDRPIVAPEGCLANGLPNGSTCTAETGTSRTGAPIRVIPLYKVTKVEVCLPDTGDCQPRR